jgi:GAF domain-containing protein
VSLDPGDVERVLDAIAHRLTVAERLAPPDDPLLSDLAAVAATALEAQAASIALYDRSTERLVFRAAAGPAAGDIVGMAIEPEAGIAGYVFTTGQPLAVADVAADPRFERSIAEASGYVPSSLLAVPIVDSRATLGVLEALDGRRGTFSLHDIDLASSIASAVASAVGRQHTERDAATILAAILGELAGADSRDRDAEAIDALVAGATAAAASEDDPTWRLVDRIAALREVDPESVDLVVDWLDAFLRHRGGTRSVRGDGR